MEAGVTAWGMEGGAWGMEGGATAWVAEVMAWARGVVEARAEEMPGWLGRGSRC